MERAGRYQRLTLIVCLLILFFQLLAVSTASSYLFLALSARVSSASRPSVAGSQLKPAAQYPAGWWQCHRNEADGYTLAMPPDWRVITLDAEVDPEVEGAAAGEAVVAQRLASWARERRDAGWGTWAAAASDGTLGNATTINIIRQPLEGEVSVEGFAEANLASLREDAGAAGRVGQRWLELTAGRALRVEVTYRVPAEGGEGRQLSMVQVYLVRGNDGYVVTGVTRPEQAGGYTPVFDGIVRSLRWTD